MDKISSTLSDLTQELLLNTTRTKPKLSICDFVFGENKKKTTTSDRRKSLIEITATDYNKKLQSENSMQIPIKTDNLSNLNANENQTRDEDRQMRSSFSQNKLPVLSKFNIQLQLNENAKKKMFPIKRQLSNPKLNRMSHHYRQYSENLVNLRMKQQPVLNQQKQLLSATNKIATALSQEKIQSAKLDKNYSIQNFKLNQGYLCGDIDKKIHISIFISKLKESDKRSRLHFNYMERKLQHSPYQLVAKKVKYKEAPKNDIKEEIMRKFNKQLEEKNQKYQKKIEFKTNEENYVSGWNIMRHESNLQEIYQL